MTSEEAAAWIDSLQALDTEAEEAKRMAIEALQERKTGKWKRVHNHVWECTTEDCGMRVSIRTPYCAYCGAKMEVDE